MRVAQQVFWVARLLVALSAIALAADQAKHWRLRQVPDLECMQASRLATDEKLHAEQFSAAQVMRGAFNLGICASVPSRHLSDRPEHRLARGIVDAVIVGHHESLARRQDGQTFDLVQHVAAR